MEPNSQFDFRGLGDHHSENHIQLIHALLIIHNSNNQHKISILEYILNVFNNGILQDIGVFPVQLGYTLNLAYCFCKVSLLR